ncbi:MAG: protein-disulfide reductase DsbD N-terminal domain-containing protein, partial [Thiolinea sp.]
MWPVRQGGLALLWLLLWLALPVQAAKDFPIGNIGIKPLDEGGGGRLTGTTEPLPPEQAFVFSGVAYDGRQLNMSWMIQPEHYLYRGKFTVRVLPQKGLVVGAPVIPPGKPKKDEFFGTIQAMYDFAELTVPVKRTGQAARELVAEISWQGCAEKLGICYPAETKLFKTALPALAEGEQAETLLLEEIPLGSVEFPAQAAGNRD